MKHVAVIIVLIILTNQLFAQESNPIRSYVEPVPQVFTPGAAGLGLYGKVPVSYFNGLPQITVPLTELRAKNFTLPVYLSYHASGNKPDEHAGPVGLGWSLNAGGCINRIVNGLKDEMDGEELHFYEQTHDYRHIYNTVPDPSSIIVEPVMPDPGNDSYNLLGPGLFWNWSKYNGRDWSDPDVLDEFARNDYPQDYEPDEFIVNIDGLSASFYFNGSGGIDIVSSTSESFTVQYETSACDSLRLYSKSTSHLDAHLFTYINKLVLKKGDGTTYTFGGDLSSIDFHYSQDRLLGRQRLVGTADTWYLTEITLPGGESLVFTYNKIGFPVVKQDVHNKLYVHYREVFTYNGNWSEDRTEEIYTNESDYTNLSFTILHPSYLSRIECAISGDYLNFTHQKTDELESDVSLEEFTGVLGAMQGLNVSAFLEEENYHLGLSLIDGRSASIFLDYRGLENQFGHVQPETVIVYPPDVPRPKERLRLDSIRILDKTDEEGEMRYSFSYNGRTLPHSYTSKFTDHWGYYTGLRHHNILKDITSASDAFYQQVLNATMDQYRAPNENLMKAEILESITFPTGLVTKFEYEAHTYSKVASCFDPDTQQYIFTLRNSSGMAGGLRIKAITDSLSVSEVSRRTFDYNNSGILSGKPLYGAIGRSRQTTTYTDPGLFGESFDMELSFTDVHYRIASEHRINQLSSTSGNHVTYGTVTEVFPDSSTVTYHYSDHNTVLDTAPLWTESNINCSLLQDPVTSMQLGRGLLLGVDYRDSSGHLVRQETLTYNQPSSGDYILMISKQNPAPSGSLKRVCVNRIPRYHPCLLSKTTVTWPEEGGSPVTESESYAYNEYRRVSTHNKARGADSLSSRVIRAEDINTGIYATMTSAGFGDSVVEQLTLLNGKVTSADLITWQYIYGAQSWAPLGLYSAKLVSSLPETGWQYFNGVLPPLVYGTPRVSFDTYDNHLNLTEATFDGSYHKYYLWDQTGMNLIAGNGIGPFQYLDFGSNNHTGTYTLSFQAPAGVPYMVDYKKLHHGVWSYECLPYSGSGMTVGSSGSLLEYVRIYPAGSDMTTYSYYPGNLLRSVTNVRGIDQSFTYDGFRRLKEVLDNNDDPVNSYQYRYSNDPGSAKNVVVSKTYFAPGGLSPYTEAEYYNKWGLKEVIVREGASVNGLDVVQRCSYDSKGRLSRTWMPYASIDSLCVPSGTEYSGIFYDSSPLNRVKAEMGPGEVWRTGNHSRRYSYLSDSTNDTFTSCRQYAVSYGPSSAMTISSSPNPIGKLDVLKTTDEDDGIVYSFKDYLGREILRRAIIEDDSGDDVFLDTYYCYDDMGRLSAVLPPSLSAVLDSLGYGSYYETAVPEVQEYAYLYRYDSRGRCIAKRLPGCDWTYFIYDESDRLVFEQDGNDREAGQWRFTLYDALGRVCLKGICQNEFNVFSNPLSGITVRVTRDYPLSVTRLYGYYIQGLTLNIPTIYEVNWWDDYSFLGKWDVPSSFNIYAGYSDPQPGDPYGCRYMASAAGLLTGTYTFVLDGSFSETYLWKVNYYDDKGKIVKTSESVINDGKVSSRFGYNFAGQLTAVENDYVPSLRNAFRERYTYTYDQCGRPLKTIHNFADGPSVTLTDLVYDPVGRKVRDKRNGVSALNTTYQYNAHSWLTKTETGFLGETFKEALTYAPEYFEIEALETDPVPGEPSIPRWGGDISSQTWTTGSGNNRVIHRYNYVYDELSRIKEARYASSDTTNKMSRRYSYDAEGNVLTAFKEHDIVIKNGFRTSDTLVYQGHHLVRRIRHTEGGLANLDSLWVHGPDSMLCDSLLYVAEPEPGHPQTPNPVPAPPQPQNLLPPLDQYSYDSVGNMTKAEPDGISSVTYNTLNLPQTVQMTSTGSRVEYQYGANGGKLSCLEFKNGVLQDEKTYMGSLICEGITPKVLLIDGGYVVLNHDGHSVTGTYYFHIKDHQGNVRLVATSDGSIIQTIMYDPYGETTAYSPSSYSNLLDVKYWYSTKEWSLKTRSYDFSARMYMPSYSRFTTMDPLCEQDPGRSPYLYCAGNPVNLVDPDGRDWTRKWRSNSVTVSMVLYTNDKESYISANLASDYWNKRKHDTYLRGGKQYNIIYDVSVVHVSSFQNLKNSNTYTVGKKRKYGNDEAGNINREILGETDRNDNTIWISSDYSLTKRRLEEKSYTGAHEIGHLLGIQGHVDGTLMSESPDDKRTTGLNQSQINQIIESREGNDDFMSKLFHLYNSIFK